MNQRATDDEQHLHNEATICSVSSGCLRATGRAFCRFAATPSRSVSSRFFTGRLGPLCALCSRFCPTQTILPLLSRRRFRREDVPQRSSTDQPTQALGSLVLRVRLAAKGTGSRLRDGMGERERERCGRLHARPGRDKGVEAVDPSYRVAWNHTKRWLYQ
jgi:hypothetical protein